MGAEPVKDYLDWRYWAAILTGYAGCVVIHITNYYLWGCFLVGFAIGMAHLIRPRI